MSKEGVLERNEPGVGWGKRMFKLNGTTLTTYSISDNVSAMKFYLQSESHQVIMPIFPSDPSPHFSSREIYIYVYVHLYTFSFYPSILPFIRLFMCTSHHFTLLCLSYHITSYHIISYHIIETKGDLEELESFPLGKELFPQVFSRPEKAGKKYIFGKY